jgi:hypothetical protein
MYNPLLGHNLPDKSWYDIAEALQVKIAKLCMRNVPEQATYHLNVMDLIDTEASAYWREFGLDLYSGKTESTNGGTVDTVAELSII